jgi:protein-tyrosine phosphatase
MTHPTWELAVEDNAALIFTPCPGTKGVALNESIEQLKSQGATVVVTAINEQEMAKKSVSDLGEQVEAAGLTWVHLPIEDDCAPEDDFVAAWNANSATIKNAIDNNEKVVMHCMGGSGRTGLLAANLLLDRGWNLDEIISKVQALRPGAFTKQVQIDYVEDLAASKI